MLISRKVTEVSEISHVNLRAGWKGAGCGSKTIIYVAAKKFWFGTFELIENLFFHIANK